MADIIKKAVELAPQEIGYIVNVQDYVRNLEDRMLDLNTKQKDTKAEIKNAETKRMCCTSEAQRWLDKVAAIAEEVAKIKQDLRGHEVFPTLLTRKAIKAQKGVEELIKQRASLHAIVMPSPSEMITEKNVPRTKGDEIERNLKEIRRHLKEDGVRVVGIWGKGGSGKTTLLYKLNNSMIGDGNNIGFDYVINVVASSKPEPGKMRDDIAKFLRLSATDCSSICSFLEGKSFLLLLDDLWDELDLSTIGIPSVHGESSSSLLMQKVVLTTRNRSVCHNMSADKVITVNCLKPSDAWSLFIANARNETLNSNDQIKSIANLIVEECKGLPLAVKVIGKAMSSKRTVKDWDDAYTSMKNYDLKNIIGKEDPISHALMLSYVNLPDDTVRECFLYCSLWPEDWIIQKDELIEHWMGRGLIDTFDDFERVLTRGRSIACQLIEASLFDPVGEDQEAVKVHDLIRDFALSMVSGCSGGNRNSKWNVETGVVLEQVSEEMALKWTEAKLVSLMHNKIMALPAVPMPECPELSTFIFQQFSSFGISQGLSRVPHGFFGRMRQLTYLDLSWCHIRVLPPDIGLLGELRYLNLSFTKITSLPDELGALKKLKYLFLRGMPPEFVFPAKLITNLKNLRVLRTER